ncbi:MAG: transporter, family, multidrug resistance protein, partial [Streptomyces sp.]|nr:transporter, family, multidrug resistance protein [Streptomyces sp.]
MPEAGPIPPDQIFTPDGSTPVGRAEGPPGHHAEAPVTRARRTSILVTLVLGGLTALPPLSMDMYLPALPAV